VLLLVWAAWMMVLAALAVCVLCSKHVCGLPSCWFCSLLMRLLGLLLGLAAAH